jgi:tetratricopeptide (TPR) repeat protein
LSEPTRQSPPTVWLSLGVALLTLAVFAPVLRAELVFDDERTITENLRAHSVGQALTILSPANSWIVGEMTWRPLTTGTYVVVYPFFGPLPAAHHAVDWLLHALNAALLLALLARLGLGPAAAAFGALCFALHPLVVGTVSMISFREETLSAAIGLSGLLLVLAERRARRAAGLGMIGLALFVKETGVSFGPLAALLPRPGGGRRWRDAATPIAVSLVALALLLWADRSTTMFAAVAKQAAVPWAARFSHAGETLMAYLRNLFVWQDLSPVHDDAIRTTFGSAASFAGVALLLLLAGAATYGLFRPNRGSLAAGMILIPLLPTLNLLVQAWTAQSDRFFYLPMLGVGLVAGWSLDRLLARAPAEGRATRWLTLAAAAAILALLAWGTCREIPRYRNAWSLYSTVAARQPGSALGQFYYGQQLIDVGRPAEATKILAPLFAKYPENQAVDRAYARALLDSEQPREAIRVLSGRELSGPTGAAAMVTLQAAYVAAGETEAAIALGERWQDAPAIGDGDRALLAANAAVAAAQLGRAAQAAAFARHALALNPNLVGMRPIADAAPAEPKP